jgi:hypothetical protein
VVLLVLVLAVVVGTGTGRGFGSVLDGGDGELSLEGRKANTQSVLVMEWLDKQAMPMHFCVSGCFSRFSVRDQQKILNNFFSYF